jgi:hypothetical protein
VQRIRTARCDGDDDDASSPLPSRASACRPVYTVLVWTAVGGVLWRSESGYDKHIHIVA